MKARYKNISGGLLLLLGMACLPVTSAQENHAPSELSASRTAQTDPLPESALQSGEWQGEEWIKWVGLASFTGFIGLMQFMRSRRRSQQPPPQLVTRDSDSQPVDLPPEVLTPPQPPELPDSALAKFDDNLESVQKAQFWLALQKPEEAIAILAPLCATNRCPRGWFLLLELYALTGRRAEYEAAIPRFRARFNARVPEWEEAVSGKARRGLADEPELMERVDRALSSTNNLKAWLRNLLIDNRRGTRQGFEWGIYQDLLLLFEVVCEGRTIQRCAQLQQIKPARYRGDR